MGNLVIAQREQRKRPTEFSLRLSALAVALSSMAVSVVPVASSGALPIVRRVWPVFEVRCGVINGPDGPEIQLPLVTRKRTQVGHRSTSETCQKAEVDTRTREDRRCREQINRDTRAARLQCFAPTAPIGALAMHLSLVSLDAARRGAALVVALESDD